MDRPRSDFAPIETLLMQRISFSAVMDSIRLGIFDTLESAPSSAGDLAATYGFKEPQTEALLDLLATHGLVRNANGTYHNTQVASEHLVRTSPFFQYKALKLHVGFNVFIEENIPELLRGHNSAREATDAGWAVTDSMEGTAQHARMGILQDTADFITALPQFSDMRTMCDIGGNHGEFSMALLDRNHQLRGEIADLPPVAAVANERIAQRGYGERLRAMACDLRTTGLPRDAYDLVLASHVLYAFQDNLEEICAMIHAALKPGGWFVAQHMNPASELAPEYTSAVEFITRMAGYKTHFIDPQVFEPCLRSAGFHAVRMGYAGKNRNGLLVAAQRA